VKALVFKGPWDLAVEDRPLRDPRRDEAVVAILATGVCGSDIHGFTGHTGRRHPNQVMGHETVGIVHELGSESNHVRVGDLVTINPGMSCGRCEACAAGEEQQCDALRVLGVVPDHDAAFAEFVIAPTANLVPLSASMPPTVGALIEPMAVGYHAVRRSGLREGDPLLVIGGGPIGQAVALAASREQAGLIIVVEPNEHRRRLLLQVGITAVAPDDVDDALAAVKPKVVIDAVGNSLTLEVALTRSTKNARIVLLGMDDPEVTVPAYAVSVAERSIIGSFCYSRVDFESTARWVESNAARLTPLIEAVEPLAMGPDLFTKLARRELNASKVLLAPDMAKLSGAVTDGGVTAHVG
jgi:2-desacetyl-2-hydroxyethyl bacteriochlorophyllide A dehydrogenase